MYIGGKNIFGAGDSAGEFLQKDTRDLIEKIERIPGLKRIWLQKNISFGQSLKSLDVFLWFFLAKTLYFSTFLFETEVGSTHWSSSHTSGSPSRTMIWRNCRSWWKWERTNVCLGSSVTGGAGKFHGWSLDVDGSFWVVTTWTPGFRSFCCIVVSDPMEFFIDCRFNFGRSKKHFDSSFLNHQQYELCEFCVLWGRNSNSSNFARSRNEGKRVSDVVVTFIRVQFS